MAAHLLTYPFPLIDNNGDPIVGATVSFFESGGSSTPKEVFSDDSLGTSAGTSVTTDAHGLPEKSSTSIDVYGDGDYYVTITATGYSKDFEWLEEIFVQTEPDEWVTSNLTPTYISATQFSVTGDKTDILTVGRMLKIELSSTTIYRAISASAYTTVTTITVSGGLTDPITSFEYGFLDGQNQSIPDPVIKNIVGEIHDTNGNEVLTHTATASAVNEVNITNAATGNNPKIGASGEANTGLVIEDSNGNEVIIAESVASAVNELTVTNSATGNAVSLAPTGDDTNINLELDGKGTGIPTTDALGATTLNGDLDLQRNGTGDITVDTVPIYGLVILDTPEEILNTTSPATTATAINSTTLNSAGAVKGIFHVLVVTLTGESASLYFASSNSVSASNIYKKVEVSHANDEAQSEFTCNLDSNNDLWYIAAGVTGTPFVSVHLVGYYV